MNITSRLNEVHVQLDKLNLVGPTAKLSGCTVEQLVNCCSLSTNIISRIWNRFTVLISKGVWVSDEAISKYLYLSALWVNSKTADGLLKGNIEDKYHLILVMERVISVYERVLTIEDWEKDREFLKPTPFHLENRTLVENLKSTKAVIDMKNSREQFISSAKFNLHYGVPFTLGGPTKAACNHGNFNFSLYPYSNYVEFSHVPKAREYAIEKLNSICTRTYHFGESNGKFHNWDSLL